jgi:hypothetical protein
VLPGNSEEECSWHKMGKNKARLLTAEYFNGLLEIQKKEIKPKICIVQ